MADPGRRRRCPTCRSTFATEPNAPDGSGEFWPYLRDPETLARPWAIPGTAGAAAPHRRSGEGRRHAATSPTTRTTTTAWSGCARRRSTASRCRTSIVDDPDGEAEVLVVGWGSSYGPIGAACRRVRRLRACRWRRRTCATSTRCPANLGDVLRSYRRVVVPEMNLGQLAMLLRAKYLVDAHSLHQGRRACRSRPRSCRTCSPTPMKGAARMTATDLRTARPGRSGPRPDHRRAADGQGLQVRPGGALVPRLRRLRRAQLGASRSCPTLGLKRENIVFVSGIGCSSRFPYYLEHLRHALHPRARADDRDGPGRDAPGPARCGSSPVTATRCRSAATT